MAILSGEVRLPRGDPCWLSSQQSDVRLSRGHLDGQGEVRLSRGHSLPAGHGLPRGDPYRLGSQQGDVRLPRGHRYRQGEVRSSCGDPYRLGRQQGDVRLRRDHSHRQGEVSVRGPLPTKQPERRCKAFRRPSLPARQPRGQGFPDVRLPRGHPHRQGEVRIPCGNLNRPGSQKADVRGRVGLPVVTITG